MTQVDLSFIQPTKPPSVNETRGRHGAHVHRLLKPWQDSAWAVAHNHRVAYMRRQHQPIWRPRPITVQVVLQFRSGRRRDAHNYTGTVVKAIVDGLVRAKIVPDDTPAWVTVVDSALEVIPPGANPLRCTVRIRPREA